MMSEEVELVPVEMLMVDLLQQVRYVQDTLNKLDDSSTPEICFLKEEASKLMDKTVRMSDFVTSLRDSGKKVDDIQVEVKDDGSYGEIVISE